jgi:hypothetical protein
MLPLLGFLHALLVGGGLARGDLVERPSLCPYPNVVVGPRGKFKDAKDRLEEVGGRANQLEEKRREVFDYMDTLARQKRERKELQVDWSEDAHRRELDEARARRTAAATKAAEVEAARNAAKLAEERAARESSC